MPQWWYDLSYDPLVSAVAASLIVGVMSVTMSWVFGRRAASPVHCSECCPHKENVCQK